MNCTLTDANVYLLELNCRRRTAETKGTGGCSCDGKLRRMDPPSSCLSISGISVCAIRLGLRSLEDGRPPRRMAPRRMPPRRMYPRRRKVKTDATKTDVPETDVAETDVAETDVPETEEGRDECP